MNDWYKLVIADFNRIEIQTIMQHYDDINDVIDEDINYLSNYYSISKDKFIKLQNITIEEFLNVKMKYINEKIKIICIKDEEYPFILKQIENPPVFLYTKGDINILHNHKIMAIVGTRKMTQYGKDGVIKFAEGLSNENITIVSGLALGIDKVALETAVKNNGKVIAVVGSGLDIVYPPSNRKLWDEIIEKGVIVSEYPLGVQPFNWNFPERNRIIAGLAKGVIVGESAKEGGSLITAKLALDFSREVFAIPGNLSFPSFEGCNNIIKRGEAKLVTEVYDILEEFNWENNNIGIELDISKLSKNELNIYNILYDEKSMDAIINETGYNTSEAISIIMELELKGYVKSINGAKYIRC
ncbi:MAG: DNA-protecting protein DprA [Fusobacteria bacterium]|nr:DNA-protecting protein DprA [Fusobacteriota bacterium]